MSLLNDLIKHARSLFILVAVVISGLVGYRASSQKHEMQEAKEKADEYETIIENVNASRQISRDVDAMPDDAVDRELHDNNYYRD